MVRFPNGGSTSIHYSNSDYRSTLNMRSEVKRAGLQWPFDHQRKEKIMALDQNRRDALNQAIEEIGAGRISAAELARQAGVSDPTAITALKRAGFAQVKRGVWRKPAPAPEKWPMPVPEELAKVPSEYAEIDRATMERFDRLVQEAPVVEERHFIDEEDSWTIPVPHKLQAMADLMGLNIEVRVWKKPQ